MTRDEIHEASSSMFNAYIDELCDKRWKAYRTERNWFEFVAVDFENHKNIHIIDWAIIKTRVHVIFTDDNYSSCNRIHLIFNQFNDPADEYIHYVEVIKNKDKNGNEVFPYLAYTFKFNKQYIPEIEDAYNYYVEKMDQFEKKGE